MSWMSELDSFGNATRDNGAVRYSWWDNCIHALDAEGNSVDDWLQNGPGRAYILAELLNAKFAPKTERHPPVTEERKPTLWLRPRSCSSQTGPGTRPR